METLRVIEKRPAPEENKKGRHIFALTADGVFYCFNFPGIGRGKATKLEDDAPEWDLLDETEREQIHEVPNLEGWFNRFGTPAANLDQVRAYTFQQCDKGRALVHTRHVCHRCGGRGYYPTQEHGACYNCGGVNPEWYAAEKLYTAERIQKMNAANDKRREKKAAADKAKRDAQVAKNLAAFPELQVVLDYSGDFAFVIDVASKAYAWDLSEKQVAAAVKAAKQDNERQAQQEAERAAATPLEAGRQELEGEVLTVKIQESQFGETVKMLVKLDTGSKVWGSVPSKLFDEADGRVLKGARVSFTAKVEVSQDDELFGFYSRPTKPQYLAAPGVA